MPILKMNSTSSLPNLMSPARRRVLGAVCQHYCACSPRVPLNVLLVSFLSFSRVAQYDAHTRLGWYTPQINHRPAQNKPSHDFTKPTPSFQTTNLLAKETASSCHYRSATLPQQVQPPCARAVFSLRFRLSVRFHSGVNAC